MTADLHAISATTLAFFFVASAAIGANGIGPNEGRVTAIAEDVTLFSPQTRAHSARLNDRVADNSVVRTGNQSHAELTFSDQTVARLWTRTIVKLREGARNLYLEDGAIFLQVPRGPVITTVQGAGVAAEVSGTSVVFQCHPKVFKFLVLEGTARLYRPQESGDSILVNAGQLVFGNPKAALSDPVDFELAHFVKTSRFITDFPPLRGRGLIASGIQEQERDKSNKTLLETNLVLYGGGTTASVNAPGNSSSSSKASAQSPTPIPKLRNL